MHAVSDQNVWSPGYLPTICMFMEGIGHTGTCIAFQFIRTGFLGFYAPPQKVAGYYVIPSELLSVCPSVCPSVRPSVRPSAVEHSCPVHNFDTV